MVLSLLTQPWAPVTRASTAAAWQLPYKPQLPRLPPRSQIFLPKKIKCDDNNKKIYADVRHVCFYLWLERFQLEQEWAQARA